MEVVSEFYYFLNVGQINVRQSLWLNDIHYNVARLTKVTDSRIKPEVQIRVLNMMLFLKTIAIVMTLSGFVCDNSRDELDGHFSPWQDVPKIINSIDATNYRTQLEQLHKLTRIKLGYPQASICLNEHDHQLYMLQTKRKWQEWWESTGKPVSELKKQGATKATL